MYAWCYSANNQYNTLQVNQESDNIWISRMKCEPSTSYSKLYPLIKDTTVNVSLSEDSSVDKQQHWRTATMINLVPSNYILPWATARSYLQKEQKQSTKIFIGQFQKHLDTH